MKFILRIIFFIGVFILLLSYFLVPYKVNEGDCIVIDEDVLAFLKMLYTIASIVFGCLLFAFLKVHKNKIYSILSFILLLISLVFWVKMLFYFDRFLG